MGWITTPQTHFSDEFNRLRASRNLLITVIWITRPSLQFPDFTLISNTKIVLLFHSTKGFVEKVMNPGSALGAPGPFYRGSIVSVYERV